ncbi:copper homeostasis protein [Arthrobacter stackebrandtii]|uniref:PF03932 family protein CutC n=1 Tax=Arthrobacter stackebrandtii TaxID=272161 RepID=A0ABS4YT73_9MICC|nr:copper homeostasis protein CutC [Arthrobacter stackebrandtii]MBP2411780.1 copper homeostasis protein [Arthrobacter stackebrandtii]PYG99172.1 copper homeostasis protein CutC [Arthrobacter stackebrandtii]
MTDLEIAVQDPAGARAAVEGGATRVELCTALRLGGLTPSNGTVEAVLEQGQGRPDFVHALVRSRGGGYVYTSEEIFAMSREIRHLRAAGVHGVVVGALTRHGDIDLAALEEWIEAADGLPVTFHRAIDACADPLKQLLRLQGTGVGRVLTSGGAVRSIDGGAVLEAMVQQGPAGIQIMAGGGVRIEDIPALVALGVGSVHLSARVPFNDPNPAGPGGGAQELDATSANLVAEARRALDSAGSMS